jgi:hypothetical protein
LLELLHPSQPLSRAAGLGHTIRSLAIVNRHYVQNPRSLKP